MAPDMAKATALVRDGSILAATDGVPFPSLETEA